MLSKGFLRSTLIVFALVFTSVTLLYSLRSVEAKNAFAARVAEAASQEAEPIQKAEFPIAEARLTPPIASAWKRITKKSFGLEVHPETSPVPNDHFNGLHAGVDFETIDDELEAEVPVIAACTGPLLFKTVAKGYGGVAVQHCILDHQDISVIYGHIDVTSVQFGQGKLIKVGQRIGILGKAFSEETDGARKHLHFGLRKGLSMDIRGYVKDSTELGEYLDAMKYMQF